MTGCLIALALLTFGGFAYQQLRALPIAADPNRVAGAVTSSTNLEVFVPALLKPVATAALIIIVVGAVIGGLMARRISQPLVELIAAAEAMSSGQRIPHVAAMDRADEVGRLGRALEASGADVRSMLDRLEHQIDARSAELSDTVERLRAAHDELRQQEHFAVVGRTSGTVGHELRNPLGVMATVVRLLETVPDASPKVKNYAAMLREQIRLSERIIAELLDRARAGASFVAAADPARLVRELVEVLPSQPSIPIHVIEPRLTIDVMLDRDRVWQVLWNLVTNAIQAIEGEGGAGEVTIALLIDDDWLAFEVRDTGPGVRPELRERIFEPLFTTKRAGVGLGLAISRAYARSQGGDLCVNAVGRGTSFILRLPLVAATSGAPH